MATSPLRAPDRPAAAVVLAGGRGTRLRPLTDNRPKPLVPFMGEPFVHGLLRRLADAGCDRVMLLVGQESASWDATVAFGQHIGVTVSVHTESEPLDTAGAARELFTRTPMRGPVLVCNGDILTDVDLPALVKAHCGAGADATLSLTRVHDTSAFGVVVCDDDGRVTDFIEKPPPGTTDVDTVNAGTYVLSPEVFGAFPGEGPLSFERVVFPGLVASGAVVLGVPSDAAWHDLGTPARYRAGHRTVLDGRCHWPSAPGLRIVATSVAVHETATVDASADLAEGVVVGSMARIGAGAVLRDCVLHDRAVVEPGARLTGVVMGAGATAAGVLDDAVLGDGERFPG